MKRQNDSYLTVKEYETIWKQASHLGAFSVILSGGEPTLRKDLFDILAVMDPRNTIFALVTNSLNLDKDYLIDLKRAGVETIHLSLDSTDSQSNDRIRGADGHFNKVMETIDEAKRQGFSVYLSTVIMHNGLKKMDEMVQYAAENDIGIVFSLACVSGNWTNEHDVLLTPEEWRRVQQYMQQNPHVRSDWTINFSMRQECPGGREKLSISCYGDVMGCGMNYISFGNVRYEPLETIWKRMRNFPAFKKRSRDCLIGSDLNYIEKYIKPLSGMTVPVRIDCHPTNPIPLKDLDTTC
ncbi:MAG: radical SAM protein [Nitrospirae bacterium]|nr:radical SAM protein [Nitrospirota bacterium]